MTENQNVPGRPADRPSAAAAATPDAAVASAANAPRPAASARRGGVRFEAHWRTISWALLDKGLQLVFGIAFLLIVVRSLPRDEYGLQSLATVIQLTVTQLFRALLLVPLIKYVAEAGKPARIAATGAALYTGACTLAALALGAGGAIWAALFAKPGLAAVLVPTAVLLATSSWRDAAVSSLEAQRRLRTVFFLDLGYYGLATVGLWLWRVRTAAQVATTVQWVLVAAAVAGALLALGVTRSYLLRRPAPDDARRILRFGMGSFGSGFGATLQQQGDQLLAGRLMGPAGLAAYNAAKLLFRVFNVLAQAINQVLMPAVSRLDAGQRRDDLRILFEKSVCFLSLALFPVCTGLVLGAKPLFEILFQGRYADSVRPFQLLVAGAFALPLATVGSAFLTGLGRLHSLVWMTWVGLGLGLGLAAWWIPSHGPVGAAGGALVAAIFGMVMRAIVLRPVIGFRFRGVVSRTRDAFDFVRRRSARSRS